MPLTFHHKQLPNGLDIVAEVNPDSHSFAAGLFVKTGSRDENPALTARFIPGLVRSAMLFAPKDLNPTTLKQQITALLEHGMPCGAASKV